jgi:hypothetical protein
MTFGSAVDAGVEILVEYAAMGHVPDMSRAYAAIYEVIARDQVVIDVDEAELAISRFHQEVLPHRDWHLTVTQPSITATIEGLGVCNGHPDIVMGNGAIVDIKTASRPKEVPSLELGFYAILAEATGATVPSVGYMTWVRSKRPYWQVIETPVTDELRRWTYERAAAYVRAKKADTLLNAKAETPQNYSFPGAARFPSLCSDCVYNPALGGACRVAYQGGDDAELA